MSVKIGINPITWTNDDFPELGGDTPVEVCLAETSQAGYRGTELGGKFPRDSEALNAVLSAHGLELVAGWYDGRILERSIEDEFEAILPHLTLLRDSAPSMWSMPTPRADAMTASSSRFQHGRNWNSTSGPPTAARSPVCPNASPISACAWPFIITWARLSRPTLRSTC